MAKKIKQKPVEREYIINLRKDIAKVPNYKKTPKAVKSLKEFIARHMRIPERDVKKVKIDKWLNRELWFRGIKNPPTKLKVKAKYSGDNVIVELAELPEKLKFAKVREEKIKKVSEKIKKEKEAEKKTEEKEEKTEDKEETGKEPKEDKKEVVKAETKKDSKEKEAEKKTEDKKETKKSEKQNSSETKKKSEKESKIKKQKK
jgi:large subunit ribosomal protein L31e